jgi:hypothetical protein
MDAADDGTGWRRRQTRRHEAWPPQCPAGCRDDVRWRGEGVRVRLAPDGHVAFSRYFGQRPDGTCILQRFGMALVDRVANTEILAITIASFAA